MKPLELAIKYMDIIFLGRDLERLNDIFHKDLRFKGPFQSFNSADDYIDSLKNDPPIGFSYEIIKSFQDTTSACLIYEFKKPGLRTTMTQLFEIEKNKICQIQLIFDTKPFLTGN